MSFFKKEHPLKKELDPLARATQVLKDALEISKRHPEMSASPSFAAIRVCLDSLQHHRNALQAAVDVIAQLEDKKMDQEELVRRVTAFKELAVKARMHQKAPTSVPPANA